MSNERLIFVTNDDGYQSKGFRALVNLAKEFGHVVAIAPERVQSGMSQAITISQPLFLRAVERGDDCEIYAFSGTPVDCSKVAFDHVFLGRKVDLVLSGINHGSNAAVNVMYSGTMGAAIEGSFYNVPSIGLSVDDHDAEGQSGDGVHGAVALDKAGEQGAIVIGTVRLHHGDGSAGSAQGGDHQNGQEDQEQGIDDLADPDGDAGGPQREKQNQCKKDQGEH